MRFTSSAFFAILSVFLVSVTASPAPQFGNDGVYNRGLAAATHKSVRQAFVEPADAGKHVKREPQAFVEPADTGKHVKREPQAFVEPADTGKHVKREPQAFVQSLGAAKHEA